jgi:hypothetical protein
VQPVLGGQLGTGIAWEITRLWFAGMEVVGLVVSALATKPAKTTEKIDAWTRSFMM